MGARQKGFEQPEETGAVAHMEEVVIEQPVQLCEEVGVVEIFDGDEVKEAVEG